MGANLQKNNQAYSQLLFGRGSGGGKDSHSRQWRLSMAVFLNRNKRPSAAPIEVADASLREAASPGVSLFPLLYVLPLRCFAGEDGLDLGEGQGREVVVLVDDHRNAVHGDGLTIQAGFLFAVLQVA